MWIQQVVSVCSKLRVKIFKGSPIPPISNALETPPPQNEVVLLSRKKSDEGRVARDKTVTRCEVQLSAFRFQIWICGFQNMPNSHWKMKDTMNARREYRRPLILLSALLGAALIATQWTEPSSVNAAAAAAPAQIRGQVLGGGAPIANSTVTLWAASAGAPRQLGQTQTGNDGRFAMSVPDSLAADTSLYLVAKGGTPSANKASGVNSAIALITVVGAKPLDTAAINEFTTVASVWTHNQFIDGTAISGHALGLRIAAGNVPNLVNLATGGYGDVIQDALNSNQTPTMAMFATLANVMAGCVARVKADACASLFTAATGRDGKVPTDTLGAAQSIVRNMAYKPERVFALL